MSTATRNKSASNPAGNVGWTMWNISNRISEMINAAKTARARLEEYHKSGSWTSSGPGDLEAVTEQLEKCARDARAAWDRMREAPKEADDSLVSDCGGIAVIGGGGSQPELRERLVQVYSDGHASAYLEVLSEYQRIVARAEGTDHANM